MEIRFSYLRLDLKKEKKSTKLAVSDSIGLHRYMKTRLEMHGVFSLIKVADFNTTTIVILDDQFAPSAVNNQNQIL